MHYYENFIPNIIFFFGSKSYYFDMNLSFKVNSHNIPHFTRYSFSSPCTPKGFIKDFNNKAIDKVTICHYYKDEDGNDHNEIEELFKPDVEFSYSLTTEGNPSRFDFIIEVN